MRPLIALLAFGLGISLSFSARAGQTTDDMLKKDLAEFGGKWIYDDIKRGFIEANQSGKPLLVVFRCVP
jgi:serine protease Do